MIVDSPVVSGSLRYLGHGSLLRKWTRPTAWKDDLGASEGAGLAAYSLAPRTWESAVAREAWRVWLSEGFLMMWCVCCNGPSVITREKGGGGGEVRLLNFKRRKWPRDRECRWPSKAGGGKRTDPALPGAAREHVTIGTQGDPSVCFSHEIHSDLLQQWQEGLGSLKKYSLAPVCGRRDTAKERHGGTGQSGQGPLSERKRRPPGLDLRALRQGTCLVKVVMEIP